MSEHVCPRCGHEDHCGYGSWVDRHPIMATVGGLFSLTFMGMMFSVYTSAAWTMVAIAAVVFGGRAAAREWRRRTALATRADYEHAKLMARQAMPVIRLQPRDPIAPRPRPQIVLPPPATQPLHGRRR
jgi:hypothetical protein